MMTIVINGVEFSHFNNVNVNWRFDSIASTFAFDLYFDPSNEKQRSIFKPGQYLGAVIKYNGKTIITGEILSHRFKSGSSRSTVQIAGYSITGVLEDCEMPTSIYPLQVNGLNLVQIAEKIASEFNISVVIDVPPGSDLSSRILKKYEKVTSSDNQKCNSFLSELANQRQVILSHDTSGNLCLTESKTKADPIFDFSHNIPGVEFDLSFNGQRMHSIITMMRQASKKSKNAGQAKISNVYVKSNRPAIRRQSSGDNREDTRTAVRNALSEELKGLELKILIQGWELNNRLVEPNSIITVQNPELYLFGKSRWFIESVNFKGDSARQVADLNCYIPEVYNQDSIINVFEL